MPNKPKQLDQRVVSLLKNQKASMSFSVFLGVGGGGNAPKELGTNIWLQPQTLVLFGFSLELCFAWFFSKFCAVVP